MVKRCGPLGCYGLKETFQKLHRSAIALLIEYKNADAWPIPGQYFSREIGTG